MADQQAASAPPASSGVTTIGGQTQPTPDLISGVLSPTAEKNVADLFVEMQHQAATAAPGTTTSMQFSYQKSKHTKETSGEEPQISESKHVEKSIQQIPPGEQSQVIFQSAPTPIPSQYQPQSQINPQQQQAPAEPQPQAGQDPGHSFLGQIPQFLQEKLGFGGVPVPLSQQQTVVSYHQTKKTTTTTTTPSGDQGGTVTTTTEETPQPSVGQQPGQQQQGQQDPGLFAKMQQHVSNIPQYLQEKLGAHLLPTTEIPGVQQHYQLSYKQTKKTTTTTTSSTGSGDQQENMVQQTSQTAPISSGTQQVLSSLQNLMSSPQPQPAVSNPVGENVQIEFSKHASRQVLSQTGDKPPHIETTSTGYSQVVQGIFNGVPVVGSIVPVVVPISVTKSGAPGEPQAVQDGGTSQTAPPPVSAPQEQAQPQPQPQPQSQSQPQPQPQAQAQAQASPGGALTLTIDPNIPLEEQLKRLGISADHPVANLLKQSLAQHQGTKAPETNVEIQYQSEKTRSTRKTAYEEVSAQEAAQKAQSGATVTTQPFQPLSEPTANTSGQQSECVEERHVDDDGNLVITKKFTRASKSKKTTYEEAPQAITGGPNAGQQGQ